MISNGYCAFVHKRYICIYYQLFQGLGTERKYDVNDMYVTCTMCCECYVFSERYARYKSYALHI